MCVGGDEAYASMREGLNSSASVQRAACSVQRAACSVRIRDCTARLSAGTYIRIEPPCIGTVLLEYT